MNFPTEPAVPYSLPLGREFQRYAGPSRSVQYLLIQSGDLQTFLVGCRRYILVQSWIDYCERQRLRDAANRVKGRLSMRGAGP